ncbi:permease [Alphaproteobacteria bacterium]|nr:permease [Alphaproteobacteria bacterium]
MIYSTLFMWFLVIVLFFIVYFKKKSELSKSLSYSKKQLFTILPRIPIALIAAGFIAVLLPQELISEWIGSESGIIGIFIATFFGVLIPSGPIVAFPIAIALFNSGAGVTQLVAFLTGWSIFQFSRLLIWEVPFLGWQFASRRLLLSISLPFIAAGISSLLIFIK